MKIRFLALLTALVLLFCVSALAEDEVVIVTPEGEEAAVSTDGLQLGETVEIEGIGDLTLTNAEMFYDEGNAEGHLEITCVLLNRQKEALDLYELLPNDGMIAYFDEEYEYPSDYSFYLQEGDSSIRPLYASTFVLYYYLPQYVIENEGSLSVSFKLGEETLSYLYRE